MSDDLDLQTEIDRLKRENAELQSRAKAAVEVSIRGLETYVMRIGPDETILHINGAFARHLGLSRDEIMGQKTDLLRRNLSEEMLMAIARPEDGGSLVRMANDDRGKVFQIKTTLHGGMLDVVMEDVTDEQQFRNLVQRYVLKDFESLTDEELRTFRFPERRFMSVSFTDLRGFTKLVEKLGPEDVRGMINAYFEEVIEATEAHEATVAQLVGDEVMAFYGAPRYFKDHAFRAIQTACEQVEKVDELCARYKAAGKEMCRCGVGINTGDVVLGNMGSAGKQTYTILGTAVNLASRICGAAGEGQILLTEVVLKAALEALPPGWEAIESRVVVGSDDLTSAGGKIEGVNPLPDDLKGKVVAIGPGIKTQGRPPEYSFRYLALIKAKGIAKPLAIISVERTRHGRTKRALSDETVPLQQAEIMVGKYRLLETIGEGGMGKVWKARDQFGNNVAIKMLRAGQGASSHQLRRFKGEAAIMARLSHRNICHIHEIGEAEGATFIAMEFVDGVSLAEVIRHSGDTVGSTPSRSKQSRGSNLSDIVETIKQEKKSSPPAGSVTGHQAAPPSSADRGPASSSSLLTLPAQRVLALMGDICEAIQFAHEQGVLHRDLKPGNIMIRPDGEPVVMDFGLAKIQEGEGKEAGETSLSIEGQIVGTIEYMAPEQARSSKRVNERADVYSLGAILYQLLTGRKHFQSSGNLVTDAHSLEDHEPVPLRKIRKDIDKDLETIALKALRANPALRYSSVSQMLEDLRRYQTGDPISARAPTATYRLGRRLQKHRGAFTVSALLLVFALLFGGYAYVEWRKQWGNWTEELRADFADAPPAGPEQTEWLKKQFIFQNRAAKAAVEPWPVRNGAMVMQQHEWCWLRDVRIRDDTKVFLHLRFTARPEAFQVCINARRQLRQWDHNPPGYSCRFGIWGGSMDLITRNEVDRKNDVNSLVVSATPEMFGLAGQGGEGTGKFKPRDFTLTFQRQGERVVLQVDGKDVHHDTYLMPLLGDHRGSGTSAAQYENIGIRTWGANVEVRSISAYRFKLPEKASPTVAGDALAEAGQLREAIDTYRTIAKDYAAISDSIAALALTRAYLLAVHLGEADLRALFLAELRKPAPTSLSGLFRGDARAKYLEKVEEVEALMLWKDGRHREALGAFPAIFQRNPETRIVVECLQAEHRPLDPDISRELLGWVVKTTRLAGLGIDSFGLTDLSALAAISGLRGLDCRDNRLGSLESLRGMRPLRALYCGGNQISTLAPIADLALFDLYCEGNQLTSLEPLRKMPLETLFCGKNQLTDLTPIQQKPISILSCSQNQIGSLDAVAHLPLLNELYCASNQIKSLEPLRQAKGLGILDCSANPITSLEPLKDLGLYFLDCRDTRLTTLEPFVTAKDPPAEFIFDGPMLPDAEIERARVAWAAKKLNFHATYAQILLALRRNDPAKIKSLAFERAGHRYLYVRTPLSDADAQQFCTRLGGHLVTITTKEENDLLRQIAPAGVVFRIGLALAEGRPRWVTGENVAFQPDLTDFHSSDRAVTWKAGSWLPVSAQEDRPMPFVIEWD